jgi:hypothetical protein
MRWKEWCEVLSNTNGAEIVRQLRNVDYALNGVPHARAASPVGTVKHQQNVTVAVA